MATGSTLGAALVFVCETGGLSGEECIDEIIRIGAVVANFAWNKVFEWCCDQFDDPPVCEEISGLNFIALECNYFQVATVGPDDDAMMWNRDEVDNFIFDREITTTGVNFGSAIDVSQPVSVNVIAVCPEPSTIEFPLENFDLGASVDNATFAPSWAIAPPDNINAAGSNTTFDIAVNSGTQDVVELNFQTSFGANIEMTGPFTATVTIWNSTTPAIVTTATITNTCTGESESISKTTTVN